MKYNEDPRNSNSGFTLIELLLVIIFMGAIAAISVNTFNTYTRYQKFSQVVIDFVNTLNTAKARAYAQVKPNDISACDSSSTLYGYSVDYKSTKFDLDVNCSGAPGPKKISTVDLTNTPIKIKRASTPPGSPNGNILFHVLNGAVTGDLNVVIYDSYGNSKNVTVSSAGVINVQ